MKTNGSRYECCDSPIISQAMHEDKLLAILIGEIHLKCHFYKNSYSCHFTLPLSIPEGSN